MATPTPWPLANNNRKRPVKKIVNYARDPYNFSWETVSSGTNPAIRVPATGPHAAGAVNPTEERTVESVTIVDAGTLGNTIYGNNHGEPPNQSFHDPINQRCWQSRGHLRRNAVSSFPRRRPN